MASSVCVTDIDPSALKYIYIYRERERERLMVDDYVELQLCVIIK